MTALEPVTIAIFAIYCGLALLLIARVRPDFVLSALILYMMVYDFAFLNLDAVLGQKTILARTFGEIVLGAAAFSVFVSCARSTRLRRTDLVWLAVLIIITVLGFARTRVDLVTGLQDYRVLVAPIALGWTLSAMLRFSERGLRFIRHTLLGIGTVIICIALYEFAAFNGDIETIWRHDFLLALNLEANPDYPVRFIRYQLIRNEMLRASSVFISAIDFSIFAAFTGVLALISATMTRRGLFYAPILLISIVGVLVSQVRVGLLILGLGLLVSQLLKSRHRVLRGLALGTPVWATSAVFVALIGSRSFLDSSSAGRLGQYSRFFSSVEAFGAGFGSFRNVFDSFWIYSGMTLGIGLVMIVAAIAYTVRELARVDDSLQPWAMSREGAIFVRFSLVQLLVALVLFSLHQTVGSPSYFLVFFMAFTALRLGADTRPTLTIDPEVPGGAAAATTQRPRGTLP